MSMEEIDIIELLKRVKEGKAPKKIELNNKIFEYSQGKDIQYLYSYYDTGWLQYYIDFETKIKILDKPIIEELEIKDEGGKYISPDTFEITAKVNEIIRYLRSKDER